VKFVAEDEQVDVAMEVNGERMRGRGTSRMLLSDFLREALGLTGTRVGCEHGVCGACTVRVDGVLARACLVLAVQCEGGTVETVEGLAAGPGQLSPLQAAFRRHHALQCGYCIPGILVSLTDLLEKDPSAAEAEIREVLSGHLCRCTGYAPMVRAALEAAAELRGEGGGDVLAERTLRDV